MATGSEKKAGFNAVLSHHNKQTVLKKLSALAGFDVGNGAAASGRDGNGLREEGVLTRSYPIIISKLC